MKLRFYLQSFLLFLTILLFWGISVSQPFGSPQTTTPQSIIIGNNVTSITKPIISVTDRPEIYPLGTYLEFLEDPDKNLTITEISSPAFSQKFVPSKWQTPTFGFTTSTYWVKLPLVNDTNKSVEWVLFLEHQLIDHVELYLPDPQLPQVWTVKKTGLLYPFITRDILDRLPAFRIPIPAYSKQNIYLRLETTTSLIVNAFISNPMLFWKHRSNANFWIGISYGIIIFAILYNFFLLISLRDIGYLYYVIIALGITICFIVIDGVGMQYLWQKTAYWNKSALFLFPLLTVFIFLQWTADFLQTRQLLPRWHRCLQLYQIATIFLSLGFFYFPYRPIAILGSSFLLATTGFTTLLGIITYRRGYYLARYYLLSCLSLFVSSFLRQLALLGFIPGSLWIMESPRIGLIALMVFLSLALGDRINLFKAEKLQEQKLALQEKDELNADLKLIQEQLLKRERKLEYDAYHDILTGLPNRAWLMQRLQYLIQNQLSYGVLFTDLDQFKTINDTLGHPVGDRLLKYASLRLQSILNPQTNVARLGGDEFVFLLEDITSMEEATKLADLVQMQLQLPFKLGNYELFISASIGINLGNQDYQKPEEILRDADLAMYQAKRKGRGRYEIFDPLVRHSAMKRLDLERELRQAIHRQEFCLYYQPIVCLKTQQIRGVEALVRWQHPSGKIISPSQFILIAEETGLINSLGWWILEESCRQMKQWHQEFSDGSSLFINVNISPVQLKQQDLVKNIKLILHKTGLLGCYLKLEITESCFLENTDAQLEALNQLRELGINLCIDDFGTGYSSLNRLHTLPINTLKIDQSFVNRLTAGNNGDGNTEIIEMIVALAHSLDMNTVAEGIEFEFQAEKLAYLGCQFGQGYLFSRPLDKQSLTQLLKVTFQQPINIVTNG